MPNSPHIEVAFGNPANEGVLWHLQRGPSASVAYGSPACSPESVQDPYIHLGTHPELVSRLWDRITSALPVRCNWVVYGAPVLVRPDTGIIFAFAGGTSTYALRLPPKQRAELVDAAMRRAREGAARLAPHHERERYVRAFTGDVMEYSGGQTFDISSVGKEWAFGRWLPDETTWCLAAYEYAT